VSNIIVYVVKYSKANGSFRVQFTVINGERKSAEFVEHLKAASDIVRGIIEAGAV
jgi:hypothetical protein